MSLYFQFFGSKRVPRINGHHSLDLAETADHNSNLLYRAYKLPSATARAAPRGIKNHKQFERANRPAAANYSEAATLWNVPEACWPIEVMAVKQTTIINANITAYSTAVGPSSDTRKRCTFLAKLFIAFSTDVRVTGLGKGIFRYKPITPKGNAYTAFGDASSEHRVRTRPVSHLVTKPL